MPADQIDIRFAEAADLSALTGLLLEVYRHYWGDSDEAATWSAATAEALIDGQSGCKTVIARVSGMPQAFATISILHPAPSEHGTLFMKDLFVSKDARGSGLGTDLMRFVANLAVERGCVRFDWSAETDNPKALEFYDRLEAERVEEKVYYRFSGPALARFAGDAVRDGNTDR